MAIDFSPLQQIDPVGGFFRGQEAARAEQERNMLLQQRQMQFEQEQENRLLSRQKMQADLATARQRQQSLAAAAKSFQQFGRDLNPQTLEEGIARAIESGDDKALDFLSKVRTEFRQSLVDRQVFGDLLDSAAPTPSVGAPAGAAPAAAMPSAAPVVAPAAAAPEPMPAIPYSIRPGEVSPGGAVSAGVAPPVEVRLSAYGRGAPALAAAPPSPPAGEINTAAWRAMAPVAPTPSELPVNALAPEPAAAPANAMLAPPAAPAVQVAGPAALPTAAPKTFEYGGRTYTPQQVNLLLRDERAGRRELGEKIVAANKPTREGMSPLGRLYAEQAALPPGDPRQQVYAAAIEKESERPDKGTQLAQYLRERQAIAQANPADPRLAIYDDVIKKMREKPEGTKVEIYAPVPVVDPNDPSKVIYVSREEAIKGRLTPPSGMEGLTPQERQKREAEFPQAKQAVTTVSGTMSTIEETIDRLLKNKDGLNGVTGLIYGRTPAVTDAARRADADIKQLRNLAFVQGLTELRAASKTGAGVGNVSNKEGDRFENLKASLDTTQSYADMVASLKRLKAQASATRSNLQTQFEDTYAYRQPAAGAAPAPAPSTGGWSVVR